jgi:hypothetical protein
MIKNCKLCEKEIPVPKYGVTYWCSHCQQYQVIWHDNGYIESEVLTSGNYHLIFFPSYQEANVVEKNDNSKKIINTFALNELTHELAVQWVNKLKTYVLFQ